MLYLDSSENFFVKAWEAIVNFFTVTLPAFFMDAENNWVWFIVIGAVILVLVALIVLLAILKKKKKKRVNESEEQARLAALEEKSKADEAAELARIRSEREHAVRSQTEMTVDELIARRADEEKSVQDRQLEEEERKLQETFAAEAASGEPVGEVSAEVAAQPSMSLVDRLAQDRPADSEPEPEYETEPETEAEDEAEPEPKPEPKPKAAPKKKSEGSKPPAAKKAADTKTQSKQSDTVMYSIVYDRTAREWVVRKSGSPRAIRRLRTKAEALEFAEQLSSRQGLALQVHKKDGKFQKQ